MNKEISNGVKINKKVFLISIILMTTFFLIAPFTARAVNTETVGILPANPDPKVQFSNAWFIYKLDLGQVKSDGIRVINNKNETVVVKLYPVDAVATNDGAFALMPEDANRTGVGSWVKLAVNEIEIPPQTEKMVPFTFSVPKNADVGDHMGGIVMQEIETGNNLTGTGVKIITRVGVRIYETVPGEVKKDFEITRFDWREEPTGIKSFWKDFLDINKKTFFFVGIKNNGNVSFSPLATLDVKNIFGRTVVHLENQEMGSVFPHEENPDGTLRWANTAIFGRYTVNVAVKTGDGPEKTSSLVIWAIPYRIIFLLIILSVIIILGRLIRKYFQEASKERMPIYEVESGDTLARLAEKFSISWERIAKVNEIRKPFEIKSGEKLFIPRSRKNKEVLKKLLDSRTVSISLREASGRGKEKKWKIMAIVTFLIIGIGASWGIKIRRDRQVIRKEVAVPLSNAPEPQETQEKTISGAFKKSSVGVSIHTLADGGPESSSRLYKKFSLAGYTVNLLTSTEKETKYSQTSVEYKTGKKDLADMVKNDLGVTEQVDMLEIPGLGTDIVIYNKLDKNNFLDF